MVKDSKSDAFSEEKTQKSENKTKRAAQSKASKAGLLFPVPKINKRLQQSKWTDRIGGTASVCVAAICEYIAREIVEASGKTCADGGKHKRMTPRDVILAIRNDPDLNRVFAGHKVLTGDKLRNISEEITLDADKRYKNITSTKRLGGKD